MKTVFTNREVPHIWAQQSQREGRGSHLFFEGPTIYSYGRHFPIAHFIDRDTVLFTTRRYSMSTAKHISYTRRAIRDGVKIIYVCDPAATDQTENVTHLVQDTMSLARTARRAHKVNRDRYYAEVEGNTAAIAEIIQRFKVKVPSAVKVEWALLKSKAFDREGWARYDARRAEIEAETKRAAEKARKEAEAAALDRLNEWKAGENVRAPHTQDIHLRATEDNIETSWGASIPKTIARKLWTRIKAGQSVSEMNLGHYRANGYQSGILQVGCHRVRIEEMERLSKILGW